MGFQVMPRVVLQRVVGNSDSHGLQKLFHRYVPVAGEFQLVKLGLDLGHCKI